MKLKCIINKNNHIEPLILPCDIKEPLSDDNFVVADLESSGGIIGYALTIDKIYEVFSIIKYDGVTRYLIQDDDNLPMFHSSKLVELIDDTINNCWVKKIYQINEKKLEIMGYDDITNYPEPIKLISRNVESIGNFLDFKDGFCNNNYY